MESSSAAATSLAPFVDEATETHHVLAGAPVKVHVAPELAEVKMNMLSQPVVAATSLLPSEDEATETQLAPDAPLGVQVAPEFVEM